MISATPIQIKSDYKSMTQAQIMPEIEENVFELDDYRRPYFGNWKYVKTTSKLFLCTYITNMFLRRLTIPAPWVPKSGIRPRQRRSMAGAPRSYGSTVFVFLLTQKSKFTFK